jgi:GMP synthase (glutamine-hydrolysing)
LAIRCLGEVNEEKLSILREADAIVREEIDAYDEELFNITGIHDSKDNVWQYFAILPGIKSVGMKCDERTYDHAVGIRAVKSVDAMTAQWARLPYEILETISTRILTEVPGASRVFYDLTDKPPGTIEWE